MTAIKTVARKVKPIPINIPVNAGVSITTRITDITIKNFFNIFI